MANNGSLRRLLFIVYGLCMIFALGYSAALEDQGFLMALLTIFVAPLFAVVFFWFAFFGWWQLLKWLGFDRFLKWSDRLFGRHDDSGTGSSAHPRL